MDSATTTEFSSGMLSFRIVSPAALNGPRLGNLITHNSSLPTPTFIAPCSRGVVPHLSHDNLRDHAPIRGVFMGLEDFIERGPSSPLYHDPSSTLRSFTSLTNSTLAFLSARRASPVFASGNNTDHSINILTSVGFRELEVNTYIAASKLLRPDAVMGIPDIPAHKPGKNRMPKMAHRTEVWLETLLREVGGRTAVWAAVLPIPREWQEEYLKTLSEHKDNLGGLVVHDSRLLGEIPESLSTLPRMALEEISDPHTLLEAVGRGVDVFTLHLLGTATDAGIALDFEFPGSEGKGRKALGKDMWNSASFATDLASLVEGCVCYACRCHHRAYVNHLLLAKEMTAWVLLQIHNAHVFDRFFMAVRESIARGSFEKDVVTFRRSYEAELPQKTGEGPRLRGYQFKTVPGERKNPKSFGKLGGDKLLKLREAGAPSLVDAVGLEKGGFAERLRE